MILFPDLYKHLEHEIKQREEETCDVEGIRKKYKTIKKNETNKLLSLSEELKKLKPKKKYDEPSDLENIKKARPAGPRRMQDVFSHRDLKNRLEGGWFGRAAGCLLGKPVEGDMRNNIAKLAKADNNYPLNDYFAPLTYHNSFSRNFHPKDPSLINNITQMTRDDDMDYPISNLLILEWKGFDFTTEDVGTFWMDNLPFHCVYTAERFTYRNLSAGIPASEAGGYMNYCREWIGAQIRADVFGWVCPGWPEKAAELAYRDAFLSHRMNGIYGEMMVAAMIAAAFIESDIRKIIEIGLSEIPENCRLSEAVRNIIKWWDKLLDWEKVMDNIDKEYGNLQGCHTITNAAIVILGLLAGEDDFSRSISISVMAGYDTDCNGATAGSIMGIKLGKKGIDDHWIEPLNDKVSTIIVSVQQSSLTDLANRTLEQADKLLREERQGKKSSPITWGV